MARKPRAKARTGAGFPFSVRFGNEASAKFCEVSGPEYRHGNSPSFYPIKMPGLGRVGNVVLRKGIFAGDANFRSWSGRAKTKRAKSKVTITLLDKAGHPVTLMALNNAWPTKIEALDFEADDKDVPIDSVALEFESASVAFFKPARKR
jgi:phage tail-like protein